MTGLNILHWLSVCWDMFNTCGQHTVRVVKHFLQTGADDKIYTTHLLLYYLDLRWRYVVSTSVCFTVEINIW